MELAGQFGSDPGTYSRGKSSVDIAAERSKTALRASRAGAARAASYSARCRHEMGMSGRRRQISWGYFTRYLQSGKSRPHPRHIQAERPGSVASARRRYNRLPPQADWHVRHDKRIGFLLPE